MFFQSVPEFVVALVLILIFAVKLHVLPATGVDNISGYILPMACIGLGSVANYTRITRSSMLEVLSEDYIRTARAKGQTEGNITYHHALRNAMIPVAQSIGTNLGNSIGGGMVVETVFGVPGVGKYIVDAITQRNYPSVLGGALIIAIVLTIIKWNSSFAPSAPPVLGMTSPLLWTKTSSTASTLHSKKCGTTA